MTPTVFSREPFPQRARSEEWAEPEQEQEQIQAREHERERE